jgi:hypothetical protein
MSRLVVFPTPVARLNGWPSTIRLTPAEARATERAFLGGMEALRTPEYSCSCATVARLVRAGIFGRDGLSDLGKAVGEALGRPERP